MKKYISGAARGVAAKAGAEFVAPMIPLPAVAGFDVVTPACAVAAAWGAGYLTGNRSIVGAIVTAAVVSYGQPMLASKLPIAGGYIGSAVLGAGVAFLV